MVTAEYRYLHTKGHTIALINVRREANILHCGFAYFTAGLTQAMTLWEGDRPVCRIAVPDDVLRCPTFTLKVDPLDEIQLEII